MIQLKDIHSPADIKKLAVNELPDLCEELRAVLARKLGRHGGHVGPNLGVVEATVALHYVFDAPADKIVFDVSHQSYVHKMLTGRIEAFLDPKDYNNVSGYTSPDESPEYDLFELGHTSTSISLATGLAKARDLRGDKENVVAFIGDGSLGGGEALEGLDVGGTLGSNFIVIVNDNQMSIAENHGALYEDLRRLRESDGTSEQNIFKSFGYRYLYVADGNNVGELVKAFRMVRDSASPIVVHINTIKGKGLPVAEREKEKFHYSAPFDLKSGAPLSPDNSMDYGDIFTLHMIRKVHDDPKVVVMTAATPGAYGFTPERRKACGDRFVDVGICEQQACGMAAGLAKGGMRPVFGVVSTFLQRAYDQLEQDISINRQPVTIVTFANGVWGIPDVTHLGIFDIAMLSNIAGLTYLAPTCKEEYLAMIDWAMTRTEGPVAVRTPGGAVVESGLEFPADYSDLSYDVRRRGSRVAIIAEGAFFRMGEQAADLLAEKGIEPTLISPRVLSCVDGKTLDALRDYELVVTMEDGILDGGFGQKVAAYLGEAPVKVKCLGLRKEFIDRYNASEIIRQNGLAPDQVADMAVKELGI